MKAVLNGEWDYERRTFTFTGVGGVTSRAWPDSRVIELRPDEGDLVPGQAWRDQNGETWLVQDTSYLIPSHIRLPDGRLRLPASWTRVWKDSGPLTLVYDPPPEGTE